VRETPRPTVHLGKTFLVRAIRSIANAHFPDCAIDIGEKTSGNRPCKAVVDSAHAQQVTAPCDNAAASHLVADVDT